MYCLSKQNKMTIVWKTNLAKQIWLLFYINPQTQCHLPVHELLLCSSLLPYSTKIDSGSKVYLNTHQRSQGMHHHVYALSVPPRKSIMHSNETFVSYVYLVVFSCFFWWVAQEPQRTSSLCECVVEGLLSWCGFPLRAVRNASHSNRMRMLFVRRLYFPRSWRLCRFRFVWYFAGNLYSYMCRTLNVCL